MSILVFLLVINENVFWFVGVPWVRLFVGCALLGGRSSQRPVQVLPLLFANTLLPPPAEPYLVLVVELHHLTSLQAGHANVWVKVKAKSAAVNAQAAFLIKVFMEMAHLALSGEHTDMTVLCRVLWKKRCCQLVTFPVDQYGTWRISKVTIWRRSGQGFLMVLSSLSYRLLWNHLVGLESSQHLVGSGPFVNTLLRGYEVMF